MLDRQFCTHFLFWYFAESQPAVFFQPLVEVQNGPGADTRAPHRPEQAARPVGRGRPGGGLSNKCLHHHPEILLTHTSTP